MQVANTGVTGARIRRDAAPYLEMLCREGLAGAQTSNRIESIASGCIPQATMVSSPCRMGSGGEVLCSTSEAVPQ